MHVGSAVWKNDYLLMRNIIVITARLLHAFKKKKCMVNDLLYQHVQLTMSPIEVFLFHFGNWLLKHITTYYRYMFFRTSLFGKRKTRQRSISRHCNSTRLLDGFGKQWWQWEWKKKKEKGEQRKRYLFFSSTLVITNKVIVIIAHSN